jgi:hypothetical protein
MKKLGWFVFFLILFASCLDDPDCYQLHNDIVGVTFRVMGTGQGDSVLMKNFSTDKFEYGPSFNYQINYFVEEGTFEFQSVADTNFLSFGYTVKNQFISEDCGSAFVLSDLRILEHDFDSARVLNPTPSKGGGTNIEIYRCPETDTLTIDFNQLYATSNGVTITNKRSVYISHPFDSITTDFSGNVFSGRAATVKLPVDLTKNETTFVFKTNTFEETLVLGYTLTTEERYKPCGIQTFVTDLAIKQHTFDSISFALDDDDEPVRSLRDPQIPNLRVFDCPKTNLIQVAFKTGTTPKEVTIKSITGDYFTGDLLSAPPYKGSPYTGSTLPLPVNLESDASTFYIQYDDDTIDTLAVAYSRTALTLFSGCPDPVIINLQEATDLSNINIIQSTLQYPLVTNVEIIVD